MEQLSTGVAAAIIALVVWVVVERTRERRKLPKDSKPMPTDDLPLIGSTLSLLANLRTTPQWALEKHNRLGPAVRVTLVGSPPIVGLADPRDVEHVLKTNFANYPKGFFLHALGADLFGDGIFATDGRDWELQRKTASHMFRITMLRAMNEIFDKNADRALARLERAAQSGKAIDMKQLCFAYTLDSIGEIGFGVNIGALDSDKPVEFARAFESAQQRLDRRAKTPLWWLHPDEFQFRKDVQFLRKYAQNIINTRRTDPNLADRMDLLSRYMSLVDEETGKPLTDAYLVDIILNFMIAGRDTTAQTMAWAAIEIANHPNVEKLMFEEIDELFKGKQPDYDLVKDSRYLQAVVDETLRLYPPVPLDPKQAVETDLLPSGYHVLAGDLVVWCAYSLNRMDKYWPNPNEFDPDRFFNKDSPNRCRVNHAYLFVPFQAGPRICLGKSMAYLEVKTLLTRIYQKYKLRLTPHHPEIKAFQNITLPPHVPVMMNVSKRPSQSSKSSTRTTESM